MYVRYRPNTDRLIQCSLRRECHREQLSIANSMKDLDSAVGRLDNIFMSLSVLTVSSDAFWLTAPLH
jgi:hypothetical protein